MTTQLNYLKFLINKSIPQLNNMILQMDYKCKVTSVM